MLNIISLSAVRDKTTGPWKVVKNLIKWLERIGYPYVLNADLNATKRLWIHDDIFAMKHLKEVRADTKVIIGPNLYNMPRNIPENIIPNNTVYIMPSDWITNMWKTCWYSGKTDIWPAGIDTDSFTPSSKEKKYVTLYLKERSQSELDFVVNLLKEKNIAFKTIIYWQYKEKEFKALLEETKYIIWLWKAETQWIALEEILSCNIPILI